MIISEITMSYPCVRHKVEVSHFTARKSTAIEWVILEAINRCDTLQQYAGISISAFFEQIFAISDADLLIRPCLIALHDMGAINIPGIDNETELSSVPIGNLTLTKSGKEMQLQGLLPGATAEDTLTIYFDLITRTLREDSLSYKEKATGIKVVDVDEIEYAEFPSSAIREWLLTLQRDKRRNRMNWLLPTTKIQDITPLEHSVLWKNTAKKVELISGMQWKVVGEENEAFNELSLVGTDFPCPDEMRNLPRLGIVNPDEEIEQLVPISEINAFVGSYLIKEDLFCVGTKYYRELKTEQLNKQKKLKVGFVFESDSFEVNSKGKQLTIYVPECMKDNALYKSNKAAIQAGIITVFAGNTSKDMAIAYIPKIQRTGLAEELLPLIDKYFEQNSTILFALVEMRQKQRFFEFVERLVKKEDSISRKAEIIDSLNTKSIAYYNQKLISFSEKERLIVDTSLGDKCKSIDDALLVLEEFSAINSLRQDESLVQRVIQIIIEALGKQNNLNEIWKLLRVIGKIKKSHLTWMNRVGLYRSLYSDSCVSDLLGQFHHDELFEIEEYTSVEQIVLNMKRISIRIQEMLPDFKMYSPSSDEKLNEIVIHHMDNLSELYDQIRQWNDEEEKFHSRIGEMEAVVIPGSPFANIRTNIGGLKSALSRFFDDSFIKYDKVYIVDTCTLMHEPGLISWFEGENTLLVIPLVVLNELDGKKMSDDESEAFSAREAIRTISNYRAYEWLKTGERSYPELLADDLDKERNDNKILSIALRYSVKKPVLLSDDINFGNVAEAHKIDSLTLDSYTAMKRHQTLSKKSSGKKKKKK